MVRPRHQGFTLIELIMAMVLLAIGLMALTGALAMALRETASARRQNAALRRAEAVADSLVLHGIGAAGSMVRNDISVWWTPESCALGRCARVRAAAAGDTLAILVRVSS